MDRGDRTGSHLGNAGPESKSHPNTQITRRKRQNQCTDAITIENRNVSSCSKLECHDARDGLPGDDRSDELSDTDEDESDGGDHPAEKQGEGDVGVEDLDMWKRPRCQLSATLGGPLSHVTGRLRDSHSR